MQRLVLYTPGYMAYIILLSFQTIIGNEVYDKYTEIN